MEASGRMGARAEGIAQKWGGVEWSGESRGWCLPFIGAGGASGRRQRVVTARVMALAPLMAGVVKEGG
jgi:hypothetical protein